MKQAWENAEKNILCFKLELEQLLEELPKSAKYHKQSASLNKSWKKVQVSLNEMDQFISPVKSVEVKCPLLTDSKFVDCWKLWKDYLNEQHSVVMRSRAELMALKRIMDFSEGVVASAIYYLEFAMGRLDKNFYKVNELEEAKATKPSSQKPFVLKLPSKYKNQQSDPLEGLAN